MSSTQAQVVRTGDRRTIRTRARGYEVLRDPALNKGTGFPAAERDALALNGLLPPVITSELEPQLDWAYAAYHAAPSDLDKHIYMWRLHDNNETLFYALLQRHLLEMLPVVYDPVVGEAIENYSEVFTRPRGVLLSIDDPAGVEALFAAVGAGPADIRSAVSNTTTSSTPMSRPRRSCSRIDDVELNGITYRIGQANHAALYQGFGFGVIVSRASKVTDEMILAAAQAVAGEADLSAPGASLLPSNAALRTTSSIVAVEVARAAIAQVVARAELDDPVDAVREAAWWPVYNPVEAV